MGDLPPVLSTRDALSAGFSRDQVAQRTRTRRWLRLRRGVFCVRDTWERADRDERHVLLAASLVVAWAPAPVLSRVSAAALWGLPLPPGSRRPVWATTPVPDTGTGTGAGTGPGDRPVIRPATRYVRTNLGDSGEVRILACRLPASERTRHRGLPVTTPARTAVDCLRHLPAGDAVAVVDAVLHRGLASPDEIASAFTAQRGWPGSAAAAGALAIVDGRRESPLESRSAVAFEEAGLPRPRCQVEVLDRGGALVARVDFLWPEHGLVGEADGLVKYAIPPPGGDAESVRRALVAEKRREERLRDLGLEVIRWGSVDLRPGPGGAAAAVARALHRRAGVAFRLEGSLRPSPFALQRGDAPRKRISGGCLSVLHPHSKSNVPDVGDRADTGRGRGVGGVADRVMSPSSVRWGSAQTRQP